MLVVLSLVLIIDGDSVYEPHEANKDVPAYEKPNTYKHCCDHDSISLG